MTAFYTGVAHVRNLPVAKSKTPPLQDYVDWCAAQEAKIDPKHLTVHKRRLIADPKKLHALVTMVHGGYSYKNIRARFGLQSSAISKTLAELPEHLR